MISDSAKFNGTIDPTIYFEKTKIAIDFFGYLFSVRSFIPTEKFFLQ
jgi:hypothetical protein